MRKYFCLFLIGLLPFASCTKEGGSAAEAVSSGKGGSLARFTIANGRLFVAEDYHIKVFDITNAALPVLKNSIARTANTKLETLFVFRNNLFVGGTDGMFIYDISSPDNPVLKGSALHLRSCDPVVANDSVSYVTLRGGTLCGTASPGLYVYDVKNISQPIQKHFMALDAPYGLGLTDTTLYVCLADKGLQVINVKEAYKPRSIKTITGESFTDVICHNDLLIAWVKTGISIYSIAQREHPVKLGTVPD